jgi:hypothetical protein
MKKVKMREKETIGRKRLRLAKNDAPRISPQKDFECMNEAKNIYTGIKILKMRTNINPLYVSFVIDLLWEQKRFTICQRITVWCKPGWDTGLHP